MFKLRRSFIVVFAVAAGVEASAQQFSEFSVPANLGASVNSVAADGCPNISKDGRTLFFASTRSSGAGGFDIYMSERARKDKPWGPPRNLGSAVNSAGNEICPTISLNRKWLYFVSDRPGGCGGQDIYVSRRHSRRDPDWEPAVNLGCVVNTSNDEFGPTYYEDDATGIVTLYFSSSRANGRGGADLYRSEQSEDDIFEPGVLIEELASAFDDARPTVRRDGLEMIFDSTRPGGLGGADLWVSSREHATDAWGPPVWMSTVNSPGTELRPSLSFDGQTLYLTSNRAGGLGQVDVWQAERIKLTGPDWNDELEQEIATAERDKDHQRR